jgi:ABC-type multidrug transport system permease subunit
MEFMVSLNSRFNEAFIQTLSPIEYQSSLVKCVENPATKNCYTFVYAPIGVANADNLAKEMARKASLPVVDGAKFGFKGFQNASAIDSWLLKNPNTTKFAVIMENAPMWTLNTEAAKRQGYRYTIQANTTKICNSIGVLGCSNPDLEIVAPAQTLIDASFVSLYGAKSDAEIKLAFSDFPHPDTPVSIDIVAEYGANFLYISFMFNYVIQTLMVVREKENHLQTAMQQMGLMDSAFWVSWLLNNLAVNTVMVFGLIVFGHICGLDVFVDNAFGLYFFFFWLAALTFTGFAFFTSAFTNSSSTARSLGMVFFIFTYLSIGILEGVYYNDPDSDYNDERSGLAVIPGIFTFAISCTRNYTP